jgi:hypothetical protein
MIPLGILAVAGASAGASPAYELISTAYGTGSSSTLTFSSIPSTYKHLQLRMVVNTTLGYEQGGSVFLQFNGDTAGANYTFHQLAGNGSGVTSTAGTSQGAVAYSYLSIPNNAISASVIDILDYASTAKNKTIRNSNGYAWTSQNISLRSNLWINTAAISSIRIFEGAAANWSTRARFSLYGIAG